MTLDRSKVPSSRFGRTWPAQTQIGPGFEFKISSSGSGLGFSVKPTLTQKTHINPDDNKDLSLMISGIELRHLRPTNIVGHKAAF